MLPSVNRLAERKTEHTGAELLPFCLLLCIARNNHGATNKVESSLRHFFWKCVSHDLSSFESCVFLTFPSGRKQYGGEGGKGGKERSL